jgi:hypothetical protein
MSPDEWLVRALQDGPVSSWWISERTTRWNSTLTGLRQDRILEEAAATGTRDPMHLASMFGLHPTPPSATSTRSTDAMTWQPLATIVRSEVTANVRQFQPRFGGRMTVVAGSDRAHAVQG